MEERKNVFNIYNIIADWFAANRPQELMEKAYLDKLIQLTGRDAHILDLGCGTGKPMMHYLISQGLQATGVDGSHSMLEIAKQNLPSAVFIQADMRTLRLNRKFHAIIAWNSFFHLPAEDQPAMFQVFRDHLHDQGILIFTSGTEHGEAWGMNGGENLFHASLNRDQYQDLLEAHHFQVITYQENDPQCGHATVWIAQLNLTGSMTDHSSASNP
ncbi:Methyltransferase domain-containing protein [Chitinophaga sp. YR627]|uniref:class I SAM-dependent DNA methyltransferase n=1 Tax=Chitinophaga sp. YR627 TaxID=1881041 RepID=UPI0008E80262|nr:class I SAM-dependent methyltransferase [Chitinophaga sp. YR627]SFN42905.1 Methyltransferase domain-containing protein [Chitinophaga sp. YR627]